MHTLGDMAKSLNRSTLYLRGLQARFELPPFPGAGYSPAYLAFLRNIIALRHLNISEDTLRDLWQLEKKLLQLLHADSTGSPTWFLDSCGQTTHSCRRLLLTNHDLAVDLHSSSLQLGLNFSSQLPELFAGNQMGEDALRLLHQYLQQFNLIQKDITAELPHLRATTRWASRLPAHQNQP